MYHTAGTEYGESPAHHSMGGAAALRLRPAVLGAVGGQPAARRRICMYGVRSGGADEVEAREGERNRRERRKTKVNKGERE